MTFAVIKVLNVSNGDKELKRQIQESAESILADVLVISEEHPIASQQKRVIAQRIQERIDALLHRFLEAKKKEIISYGSFVVLEREYMRIQAWLAGVILALPREQEKEVRSKEQVAVAKKQSLVKKPEQSSKVSDRQKRILEILRNKDKAQVWELQKIFPQVTKRTLRRDLDDLLQQNLVVRIGEWNSVSYQIT